MAGVRRKYLDIPRYFQKFYSACELISFGAQKTVDVMLQPFLLIFFGIYFLKYFDEIVSAFLNGPYVIYSFCEVLCFDVVFGNKRVSFGFNHWRLFIVGFNDEGPTTHVDSTGQVNA